MNENFNIEDTSTNEYKKRDSEKITLLSSQDNKTTLTLKEGSCTTIPHYNRRYYVSNGCLYEIIDKLNHNFCIINLTNDRLTKQKLELEIQVLQQQLQVKKGKK